MNILEELELFLKDLKKYKDEATNAEFNDKIKRKCGALKKIIINLTASQYFQHGFDKYDMWIAAFNPHIGKEGTQKVAISFCIDATNEAIGQLEHDIEKGIRDKETGEFTSLVRNIKFEVPKAFISHGKESVALNKLEDFLHNLGIIPLIVKKQASLDKDLPDKINSYLNQADFIIVLATGDDKVIDDKTGKEILQPRQNVIHEIGLAQKSHPGKIIYLLEEVAEFPSNIRPKVWESFKQRNMLGAFLCILRELRALGILVAIKPS